MIEFLDINKHGVVDVNEVENYPAHVREMHKAADEVLNQAAIDYELEEDLSAFTVPA